MKREPFQIYDGRMVRPHKHHADVWMLEGNRVTVEVRDGEVVVTDEVGRELHRGPVGRGGRRTSRAAAGNAGDTERGNAPARFATFNAFMDVCCPLLSHLESKIWLLLFRDTKPDGLARTTSRNLAERAGCSLRAVSLAMNLLKSVELLEVVAASTNRACTSVFRVNNRPDLCLEKLRCGRAKSNRITVATISTVDGDGCDEAVATIATVAGGNRGKN